VQSGQLAWLVDPATGAAEVAINLVFTCDDGMRVQLRDRTVHAGAYGVADVPGLATAPALLDAAGEPLFRAALAGRLDTAALARGAVWLRAFDLG
jgi:hypothetical protein